MDLRSYHWKVILRRQVILEALDHIEGHYGGSPAEKVMRAWLLKWLDEIQRRPLDLLGYPPRKTDDPNVYRFPGSGDTPISGWADLRFRERELEILRIVVRAPSKERS